MSGEELGAGFGEENLPRLASSTLSGDLVNFVTGELKAHPDKWERMSEGQQSAAIDRITARVESAVKRAVTLIASHNRASVRASIESCTIKDKLKVVLTVPLSSADRHEVIDATGDDVLLVLPDYAAHIGGDKPKPEADQPELPLGEPDPVDCTTCGDAGEVSDPEADGAMVTCPACGGGLAKDGATVTGDGTGEALPGIEGSALTVEGMFNPLDVSSQPAGELEAAEVEAAEIPEATSENSETATRRNRSARSKAKPESVADAGEPAASFE